MAGPKGIKLRIELQMHDQASDALKKFEKNVDTSSGKIVGKLSSVVGGFGLIKSTIAGLGVGYAVKQLFNMVEGAAAVGDEIGKMSQRLGLSTELLSELKYAAELSDVSLEQLSVGIGQLNKNMFDFARGSGEGKVAFDALGISVKNQNGQLRDVRDVLFDVSEKFAGMKDGAEKTALAMKLFGRSGKELIPFLNAGSEGFKQISERIREYGLVWTPQATKQAEMFNDKIKEMGYIWEGVKNQLAMEVLPSINVGIGSMTETMAGYNKEIRSAIGLFTNLVDGIVFGAKLSESLLTLGLIGPIEYAGHTIEEFEHTFKYKTTEMVHDFAERTTEFVQLIQTWKAEIDKLLSGIGSLSNLPGPLGAPGAAANSARALLGFTGDDQFQAAINKLAEIRNTSILQLDELNKNAPGEYQPSPLVKRLEKDIDAVVLEWGRLKSGITTTLNQGTIDVANNALDSFKSNYSQFQSWLNLEQRDGLDRQFEQLKQSFDKQRDLVNSSLKQGVINQTQANKDLLALDNLYVRERLKIADKFAQDIAKRQLEQLQREKELRDQARSEWAQLDRYVASTSMSDQDRELQAIQDRLDGMLDTAQKIKAVGLPGFDFNETVTRLQTATEKERLEIIKRYGEQEVEERKRAAHEAMIAEHEEIMSGQKALEGFKLGLKASAESYAELGSAGFYAGQQIFGVMTDVTSLYDTAISQTRNWGDAFKQMGVDVGRVLTQLLVRIAAVKIAMAFMNSGAAASGGVSPDAAFNYQTGYKTIAGPSISPVSMPTYSPVLALPMPMAKVASPMVSVPAPVRRQETINFNAGGMNLVLNVPNARDPQEFKQWMHSTDGQQTLANGMARAISRESRVRDALKSVR